MPNIPAPPTTGGSQGAGIIINVVSSLPPPTTDVFGQYINVAGVWEDYWIVNSYDTDQHVFQLGITSPTGFGNETVAFVQTAAPTLIWTCQWTASKQGDLPSIPDPVDLVDSGWVLLHSDIEPEMVEVLPDGYAYVYHIRGTYWYGHSKPSSAGLFFPKAPWLKDTNPMGRAVQDSMFVPGLADTPGNTGTNDDMIESVINAFDDSKNQLTNPVATAP